jgi:hypothetical protein
MNDLDDEWRRRTPKNSVVYGSGERRIRGQRRIALQNYFERDDVNKGKRAVKHLQGSGNVHDLCSRRIFRQMRYLLSRKRKAFLES